MCGVDNYFTTYVEICGNFTEAYRIIIAFTEIEIQIVKQEHVFFGYKPYFVRPGHTLFSKLYS